MINKKSSQLMDKLKRIKPLRNVFNRNCIPITFSSSDYFSPYLSVTISSLLKNANPNMNYDLVVFHKDITPKTQKILTETFNKGNVSLRFFDLSALFSGLNLYTPGHISIETYFRLVIPLVMKNYNKILFLDSDLAVLGDIKELYDTDVSKYALSACIECLMSSIVGIYGDHASKYMREKLHLKNVDKYFQAGVMVLNLDYFNKNHCAEKLFKMVTSFDYRIVDQDALNELLNDKNLWLNNEWNWTPLQKHMKEQGYLEHMSEFVREKYLAVKDPKILHFADREKPWFYPEEDMAYIWWSYARQTPFYEEILGRMIDFKISQRQNQNIFQNYPSMFFLNAKKIIYKIKKLFSKGEKRKKYKMKYKKVKSIIKEAKKFKKNLFKI